MNNPNCFALLICLIFNVGLSAQSYVTGTIKDQNGNPLIGTSIFVKGTTLGGVTDIEGKYLINVPDSLDKIVLVISHTGFNMIEFDPDFITANEEPIGNFAISLEFGEICSDGYRIQFHKTFQPILLPLQGRKRVLLSSIKKKKLRNQYVPQLNEIENLIEKKLGQLWFCLQNDDPCKIKIRENYLLIVKEVREYSDYLKSAREKIKSNASIEQSLAELSDHKTQMDNLKVHQCRETEEK